MCDTIERTMAVVEFIAG